MTLPRLVPEAGVSETTPAIYQAPLSPGQKVKGTATDINSLHEKLMSALSLDSVAQRTAEWLRQRYGEPLAENARKLYRRVQNNNEQGIIAPLFVLDDTLYGVYRDDGGWANICLLDVKGGVFVKTEHVVARSKFISAAMNQVVAQKPTWYLDAWRGIANGVLLWVKGAGPQSLFPEAYPVLVLDRRGALLVVVPYRNDDIVDGGHPVVIFPLRGWSITKWSLSKWREALGGEEATSFEKALAQNMTMVTVGNTVGYTTKGGVGQVLSLANAFGFWERHSGSSPPTSIAVVWHGADPHHAISLRQEDENQKDASSRVGAGLDSAVPHVGYTAESGPYMKWGTISTTTGGTRSLAYIPDLGIFRVDLYGNNPPVFGALRNPPIEVDFDQRIAGVLWDTSLQRNAEVLRVLQQLGEEHLVGVFTTPNAVFADVKHFEDVVDGIRAWVCALGIHTLIEEARRNALQGTGGIESILPPIRVIVHPERFTLHIGKRSFTLPYWRLGSCVNGCSSPREKVREAFFEERSYYWNTLFPTGPKGVLRTVVEAGRPQVTGGLNFPARRCMSVPPGGWVLQVLDEENPGKLSAAYTQSCMRLTEW